MKKKCPINRTTVYTITVINFVNYTSHHQRPTAVRRIFNCRHDIPAEKKERKNLECFQREVGKKRCLELCRI